MISDSIQRIQFSCCIVYSKIKVAYFCHHLSDNYVDLSDLYVDLSDHYVDLSENYHQVDIIF